ncbi:MAG: pyridoxamine 5'-phosphate oxidase family protein [Bacteroidales bacterium]|nr:pyridoxamine 5'-phosphate oxidase family protein [Bacteroidales bacterium]
MKNRQITLKSAIEEIIKKCDVCYVGMVEKNAMPYVLPFNFGYSDGVIFLHSGQTGKKINILKNNNSVCISFSTDHQLGWQTENVACSYSMKYRSALVYGKVYFIEEKEEKIQALNIIMAQYSNRKFKYNDPAVSNVLVMRVEADKMEGRAYGY